MTQKPINLKGKKVLRSIELHPDLKPEAVKRLLNEMSANATKRARINSIAIVIVDA